MNWKEMFFSCHVTAKTDYNNYYVGEWKSQIVYYNFYTKYACFTPKKLNSFTHTSSFTSPGKKIQFNLFFLSVGENAMGFHCRWSYFNEILNIFKAKQLHVGFLEKLKNSEIKMIYENSVYDEVLLT